MQLLSASRLGLYYGDVEVLADVTVAVHDRDRIGIVGPNGGGKTSLVRVLLGDLGPTTGGVVRAEGVRIGYVPQVALPSSDAALGSEIMTAFDDLRALERAVEASAMEIQVASQARGRREAERRYTSLLEEYEAGGGPDYRTRMERVAAGVGLTAETLATPASAASGGERTRAALARALLSEPNLLVLDEPTNYLDLEGLTWLENLLSRASFAFLVVSHDRHFLDEVAEQVWEVDRGRVIRYRGNYTKYRALRDEARERQQKEFERQQEYVARQESFIRRYHAGQRAREAKGRATRLARLERLEAPGSEARVAMAPARAGRSGEVVLSTRGLRVGFVADGAFRELLAVPDLLLVRGSRTAVIGANGTGKTTLVNTLLGLLPPITGEAVVGHNVKVGYHRQGLSDLRDERPVLDSLLDVRNMPVSEARGYLARFLFTGDEVFKLVGDLSGGERGRLSLARLLVTAPNLLVLDEPTTHLDIPSREALEGVLGDFDGTLLVVSHDRRFVAACTDQLLVLGGGRAALFAGPFEEWERSRAPAAEPPPRARRRRQLGASARGPGRSDEMQMPQEDREKAIAALEEALRATERQLEAAAERRDVADIARLGREHEEVTARLEQAWRDWSA